MNAFTPTKAWDAMKREERVEAIRPLLLEGLSQSQIAIVLGAPSRNVVIGLITRHIKDIRPHGKRPSQLYRTEIIRRARAGKPKKRNAAPGPLGRRRTAEAETLTPPPATGSIAFMDALTGQCVYPYGEPTSDMLVCGNPVKQDRPYCHAHCRIAYVPVKSDGKLRNRAYRGFR